MNLWNFMKKIFFFIKFLILTKESQSSFYILEITKVLKRQLRLWLKSKKNETN